MAEWLKASTLKVDVLTSTKSSNLFASVLFLLIPYIRIQIIISDKGLFLLLMHYKLILYLCL